MHVNCAETSTFHKHVLLFVRSLQQGQSARPGKCCNLLLLDSIDDCGKIHVLPVSEYHCLLMATLPRVAYP